MNSQTQEDGARYQHVLREVNKMSKIDMDWLSKAIETIQNKIADKLTKDNVTIYRVKNIIRVDIKEE